MEEQYFVLAGQGEIWRATDEREAVTALRPGRWVQLPAGMRFQYRANFGTSLVFLVVVLPSWRADLFHTIPDGRWPPGVDDETPPTRADELVDGWMSGDLPDVPDYLAPDGSEIRLLGSLVKGNLTHCTLRGGTCSAPVRHRTVHEIWYVLEGHGELWRKLPDGQEEVVSLWPGIGVEIPTHTSFQFRATGADALRMILLTMPRWPGSTEAVLERVGRWPASTTAG
jgi:mannose-6-phosphate isomerase-like protein (cupin superfamily)